LAPSCRRIILKRIFYKVLAWSTEFIWLKIWKIGGLLWTRQWTIMLRKKLTYWATITVWKRSVLKLSSLSRNRGHFGYKRGRTVTTVTLWVGYDCTGERNWQQVFACNQHWDPEDECLITATYPSSLLARIGH
jgi:hypothetical protein